MKKGILALWLGALYSGVACAGPADYVYTPTVEQGEREIDFKFGYAEGPGSDKANAGSLGLGYGATQYWFTEIYLKRETEDEGGGASQLAEWENKFQLTETGKYPVDVGLITELEAPVDGGRTYEFKIGTLFQTDFDLIQLNGNVLFERQFHDGAQHDTVLLYQWQAKYRWRPAFEFGLQGFGELGKWDDWEPGDQQQHRLGPAVFGKLHLGGRQAIRYNAAWLVGTTPASYDQNLRLQVEYEF